MNVAVNAEVIAFIYSFCLTFVAATCATLFSALLGAKLALFATEKLSYALVLGALFMPFAIGSSIWAFTAARLLAWTGMQELLLQGGAEARAFVFLAFGMARSIPLGILFCATALHPYTMQVRSYLRSHEIPAAFYVMCALRRFPASVLLLVGLFSGAMMASESSLPLFLYRANPGTPPETVNLFLSRIFKEFYAMTGPATAPFLAGVGAVLCLLLLLAALAGALSGIRLVGVVHRWLLRSTATQRNLPAPLMWLLNFGVLVCTLPALCAIIGGVNAAALLLCEGTVITAFEQLVKYLPIACVSVAVAVAVLASGLCLVIALRYGRKEMLEKLDHSPLAACFLMLPAFIPVLSIVFVLGQSTGTSGIFHEYAAMLLSHFVLHFSIFFFICITLISAIPERHVAWQRSMRMSYLFSLLTDGVKRHRAALLGLLGVVVVQVVTDGVVSRWFSYILNSPEEALYAAVFGRLSTAYGAAIVVLFVSALAMGLSVILGGFYARGLARGRADG